ncbi:neprilysin-3-like isoform X2 [Xenia sp. Carnegie-2017]|uniref:neprilysin-3-like isoform X2 n=1 Tax=Xenia sp. Carnegie-2017 TaxID=2897299 RepID=UPI001F0439BE|nr:neprilysin-3-like isoform X2 [Xenia sp. Carnegie-2017]
MEESSPFVCFENEDEMWEDDNQDVTTAGLHTARVYYHHPASCSRTKIGLAVFVPLAVTVIVTLSILLAQKKTRNSDLSICLNTECITASYEVMSAMNFSADPCDDFYNYACGSWERDNEIPDAESSWGQFDILSLANDNVLKKLIQDPNTKAKYGDINAVQKAYLFYETCMNRTRINNQGAKPLKELISSYYSWNVTGNESWSEASWDFLTAMVDMQQNLSVSPFFSMSIGADYFNSTVNVIKLDQSGLGMTKENYLLNTADHKKIRKAYQMFMKKTVTLLGANEDDAHRQMMDVYELEKKIAEIYVPVSERRNIEKYYKKLKVKELIDFTGDQINWLEFLQRIFNRIGYSLTNESMVVVLAKDYLKNVTQIIKEHSKSVVANYMMWRVVHLYMPALSDDFKVIYQDYKKERSGTIEEEPQWRQCLSSTAGSFGMALGLLYVDKKFGGESKAKIKELVSEIRNVFINNLKSVEWMDQQTREKAEEKAKVILENVGYPDYLRSKKDLDEKYDGFQPNNDFFGNILKNSAFVQKKTYEKIKQPIDYKEWLMNPQTVNAYYTSTKNKIVFPAGILQAPFYNKDRPRALNYGSIGAVVGHEITHGFDDNGRRFNKFGNLVKWWSNSSISKFKHKTECLVKQYSKYKFFGENIKGKQTLGENIADNGGLKQAFQAYQLHKNKLPVLPGINVTNDQLFFIGYGQVWCGKFRRQTAILQVENGVHTPGKYRVIGTLSNSHYFAKAFNCPEGSKMNPKNKCAVW